MSAGFATQRPRVRCSPTTTVTITVCSTEWNKAAQAQAPCMRSTHRAFNPSRRPIKASRLHAHNAPRRWTMCSIHLRTDLSAPHAQTYRRARIVHCEKRGLGEEHRRAYARELGLCAELGRRMGTARVSVHGSISYVPYVLSSIDRLKVSFSPHPHLAKYCYMSGVEGPG